MRKLITAATLVAALAVAALGAGCGSTMSKSEQTKTVTVASNNPTPIPANPAPSTDPAPTTPDPATTPDPTTTPDTSNSDNLTGPVGTSFSDTDDSNNVMDVKLTQVIDHARGANEFETPDNGKRFVGAKFEIVGKSGHFNDDANSDATLIGSDGQSYSADFNDIVGCTNFNAGGFNVGPGQHSVGCVVFQVPDSVRVNSVQWNSSLFSGNPATWTVGGGGRSA